MKLSIDAINQKFQPEENIEQEIVEQYVRVLQNGGPLLPVTVYSDGEHYWLFDGFHRVRAAQILKLPEIEAEIVQGTYADMEKLWQEYLQALRENLRRSL